MDRVELSREVEELSSEVVALRRHFHQYPELGFEERKTAGFVAAYLRDLGLEVREGVAGTGVTALLRGSEKGKTVLYRADMDALRIQEENEAPYRSKHDGVAHMCGHDAHMAVALATVKLFASRREGLRGNVKLAFQPCEELAPGGAGRMIEEGVMDDPAVDGVIGMHVWQGLPSGTVGIKSGPVFAAVDLVSLKVRGKGGHGALPQHAVDPVLVSAYLITALQGIVTREIDPLEPVVLTFGSVHAGTTFNVIPEEALIQGTLRYFNRDAGDFAAARISETARKMAEGFRAKCEVEITSGYPPLFNDPGFTAIVLESAREVLPDGSIAENEMTMGSEDMTLFLRRAPGCYFLLGTSNRERALSEPHHSPRFDIDEDALSLGMEIVKRSMLKFLNR